ncbi:hypothetical protein PV325_000779 [Microctonus aethiopoides]|uniref:Protein AAR2 homolog n=1 Tax=Microctonus aethiopoides TaxID=144406 RepID=A0AA39F6U4_9HYME|nr:hypothetical protein PV325_000779 [Microctonus aethiopoides]KAK0163963.1 hypothetical protein PV328_002642 [Microctonus aethiopoides]
MASNEQLQMNPDIAKFLLERGGTLIVTDVPPGTDFGIDFKSWTTGDNFKGIKMLPPGLHFIHYSAVSSEYNEMSPRVGFFHIFHEREFLVKKWDNKDEGISAEDIDEEVVNRFKCNLKNLDKFLGPYPYDTWKEWQKLTSKIDDELIKRCQPLCGYVRAALELENCDDNSRPRGSEINKKRKRGSGLSIEAQEELLLPTLKPKPGTELRLTELPDKTYPDNATPTEITQHSLDTSYALNIVIEKLKQPLEIIGELQLSFICFLVGQSLDAFDHWKKLIALICGADKLIPNRRAIYIEFLRIIEIQLSHVPEDMLCDIVANNNFVYHHLRKLFANIEMNMEIDGKLKSEAKRLRERITETLMWDFTHLEEEEDDEAPVIVSL